jgi:hypothetical protein
MKTLAGLAVLALTAAGCAATPPWHASWHAGWSKPEMTGEAFEADVRNCDREAMRVAAAEPGHQAVASPGTRSTSPTAPTQRRAEHEKAYRDCMKAKGYTATKGD